MSRRDIILFAIAINVGLLTLLFATARNTGANVSDDTVIPPSKHEQIQSKASPQNNVVTQVVVEDVDKAIKEIISEKKSAVKVTAATAEGGAENLPLQEKQFVEITVKMGDYLERIARNNGTTISEIMQINGLKNSDLRVGQTLKVPAHDDQVAHNKNDEVAASREADTAEGDLYTVHNGDNPWLIAMRHKMSLNELLRLNELDEASARKLRPGDKLRVR